MTRMKPSGEKSKCGILNKINNLPNNANYIKVFENVIGSSFAGITKTVINCSVVSNWPSGQGKAYFIFQLFKHRILPTHITMSRRGTCSYAKKASLQGYDASGWKTICTFNISFSSNTDTNVKECKGERYYSDFKVVQEENSGKETYLEMSNFDIFGYFMSESMCFRTRRCREKSLFLIYLINLVLCVI